MSFTDALSDSISDTWAKLKRGVKSKNNKTKQITSRNLLPEKISIITPPEVQTNPLPTQGEGSQTLIVEFQRKNSGTRERV
jgi:hypothetical protein